MSKSIIIDRDKIRKLSSIIENPANIGKKGKLTFREAIDECINSLSRLRMGGRSVCLVAASVLLWHEAQRSKDAKIDIEQWLALAFRISMDPSFIQPEWGIVLAGVLIEKYVDALPEEIQVEIINQARRLLCYLEDQRDSNASASLAASALLRSWDAGFPNGLNPVIKSCFERWPDTSEVSAISDERLKQLTDEMESSLPASISEREKMLYRLYLERSGEWKVLANVSLG